MVFYSERDLSPLDEPREVAGGTNRMGGGPLQLQEEHLVIAHAPAREDGFDRHVEGFSDAEVHAVASSKLVMLMTPFIGVRIS